MKKKCCRSAAALFSLESAPHRSMLYLGALMKKSARVTLTVLAGVASAANAQQPSNPCAPNSFNPAACQTAVKSRGYCDGAAWVPQHFQTYPYYSGLNQAYAAGGGVVTPASSSTCRATRLGGFGAHGAAAHVRSGS